MASFLSPIMSSESSSTDPDIKEIDGEEDRRLMLARSQCHTPSMSSQLSCELDDEHAVATDHHDQHRARCATNGAVSSGGSSIAQQYLFHTATSTHHHNHNNNNNNNYANQKSKKFKQILQSIPLPLVATSIITVLILCLLLSECKSLQVAQGGAVQSLVMEPTLLQGDGQDDDAENKLEHEQVSAGVESELWAKALRRQQPPTMQAAHANEMFAGLEHDQDGAPNKGEQRKIGHQLLRHQLVLKREIIGDLSQQEQLYHHNRIKMQHQSKRQSESDLEQKPEQQQEQQVDSQSGQYDTLGAMLLGTASGVGDTPMPSKEAGSGGGGGEQEQADGYIDGEPGSRPSNLRSSALQLDLNEPQQQQQQTAQNNRHRYQKPQQQMQQQQQQQQHQQRQTYKTNEDHMKHFQHLSNNHDRPFDVAQIQCNNTEEGFERFACPTPDFYGRYRCIEDRLFCDGYYDCPGGEDEGRVSCMYYKLFVSHIDILTNTFLTWMKKQNRQSAHRFDVGMA